MTAVENPYAGQGSVLLDIGGEVGAVVVAMPAAMLGDEVEIRPLDRPAPGHLPHMAVVNRPVLGGQLPSLVYAEVLEGAYGLCLKGSARVVLALEVVGGEVTTADWPQ